MSELHALERTFKRAILDRTEDLEAHVIGTAKLSAHARVHIYRDAYRLRLREALAANYPRLQQLVGEEAFAAIADAYIDAHPSRTPSIRWFGEALARQLERAFAAKPWLAELARWEWAIAAAFDAPDAPPIDVAHLAQVTGDRWPNLRFAFHPSVQCLSLQTNAPNLFKALTEGVPPPEALETPTSIWLIWRQNLTTRFRSLEDGEAAALNALMRGETFATLCTELCEWYAPEQIAQRAAAFLREWVDAGMVCELRG